MPQIEFRAVHQKGHRILSNVDNYRTSFMTQIRSSLYFRESNLSFLAKKNMNTSTVFEYLWLDLSYMKNKYNTKHLTISEQ